MAESGKVLSLREAKRVAKLLGVVFEDKPGSGEIRFSHPVYGRMVQNRRKKDATGALIRYLRSIAAALGRQLEDL